MTNLKDKLSKLMIQRFIDRMTEIDLFDSLVEAEDRETNLLIVRGVSGIGKTALLSKFRQICQERQIPAGVVDLAEQPDSLGVLHQLREDLRQGTPLLEFSKFEREMQRYRDLQAKLELNDGIPKSAFKLIAKGALMGLPFVPTVGPILGNLVDEETLIKTMNAIHRHLGRQDAEFYLNPAGVILDKFLTDVNKYLVDQTVVFMFDSYEQVGPLDNWIRDEFIAQLGERALVILATRDPLPSAWNTWLPLTRTLELTNLSEADVYEYAKAVGISDSAQLQAIVSLCSGYPLAVVIVSEYTRYSGDELLTGNILEMTVAIKELARQLIASVPPEAAKILSECVVLRWFNADILRYMFESKHVDGLYSTLTQLPYMQPRHNGLSLPDEIRHYLCQELKQHHLLRYRELNEKAAQFYQSKIQSESQVMWQVDAIEYVFHSFEANIRQGVEVFARMFRRAELTRDFDLCHRLVTSAEARDLSHTNSRWTIQLARMKVHNAWGQFAEALEIGQSLLAEMGLSHALSGPVLATLSEAAYELGVWDEARKYSLWAVDRLKGSDQTYDLGKALIYLGSILRQHGDLPKALECFEYSQRIMARFSDDFRLAQIEQQIGILYFSQGVLDQAMMHAQKSGEAYKRMGDPYGESWNKLLVGMLLRQQGYFNQSFDVFQQAFTKFDELNERRGLAVALLDLGGVCYFMGRFEEGAHFCQQGLAGCDELGMVDQSGWGNFNLGRIYVQKGQLSQALQCQLASLEAHQRQNTQAGIAYAEYGLAEVKTALGQIEEAFIHLQHAAAIFRSLKQDPGLALAYRGFGEIHHRNAAWAEATEAYRESANRFRSASIPYETVLSLLMLSEATVLAGEETEDLSNILAEVDELLDRSDFPILRAHLQSVKALIMLSTDRMDLAEKHAVHAFRIALKINHHVLDRLVERLTANINHLGNINRTLNLTDLLLRVSTARLEGDAGE